MTKRQAAGAAYRDTREKFRTGPAAGPLTDGITGCLFYKAVLYNHA